jgi:hypothetical protein
MKTTINNSRKISGRVSILIIMTLLSTNLFAQRSFSLLSINDLRTIVHFAAKADRINILPLSENIETDREAAIEDWMKNPSAWIVTSETLNEMLPVVFIEEQIEIEEWMSDPNWNISIDEDIQIENWMTTPWIF